MYIDWISKTERRCLNSMCTKANNIKISDSELKSNEVLIDKETYCEITCGRRSVESHRVKDRVGP